MAVGFPAKTDFATGDVLTATNVNDITGTLNLLQQDLYPAGRNKVINGDFSVNQRSFTNTTASGTRGFDLWLLQAADGTNTYSAETFTAGTAPVVGYESTNFARIVSTGQTLTTANSILAHRIENVRTLANQTTTVSFWAKAASSTPKVAVEFQQFFGTAGSASVNTYGGQVTLSTSWARYSVTFSGASIVPSIAGKTITSDSSLRLNLWTSAGSSFGGRTGNLGIQSATIDFWGVQVENGSTASPFQTASGSIAGELALCQRYYYRTTPGATSKSFGIASASSTTAGTCFTYFPVEMRTIPSALDQTGTATEYSLNFAGTTTVCSAVPTLGSSITTRVGATTFTVASGLVAGQAGRFQTDATTGVNAYLGWSADV